MFKDGFKENIYYRYFQANNAIANVFAIHGLGGHCLWFDQAAELFNKNNIGFFSFDLPGFGQSKYEKGYINSYNEWVSSSKDILWWFLNHIGANKPIFVLGHSMGALVALVLSLNVKTNGWILSVPGFKGTNECFHFLGFIFPMLVKTLINPRENIIVPFGPELLTKNKTTQLLLKKDPHRIINLNACVYFQVYLLSRKAISLCPKFAEPVLMLMAKEDKVCSSKTMKECFNQIKSHDKTKKEYENSYHDLFVEDGLDIVVNDITKWILTLVKVLL